MGLFFLPFTTTTTTSHRLFALLQKRKGLFFLPATTTTSHQPLALLQKRIALSFLHRITITTTFSHHMPLQGYKNQTNGYINCRRDLPPSVTMERLAIPQVKAKRYKKSKLKIISIVTVKLRAKSG